MSLKKSYRPWDNYDPFSLQVRTYGAQEAVKRAHQIVQRNSEFSQKLEERYTVNTETVTPHKNAKFKQWLLKFFENLRDQLL